MSRTKKIVFSVCGLIIAAALSYGAYFGYSVYHFAYAISEPPVTSTPQTVQASEKQPVTTQGTMNILVLGIDSGDFAGGYRARNGLSDTIMVLHVDQSNKKISLLSVPRDSRVNIPGRGLDKINAANAYGGIDLASKTITDFLGIPINHYIRLNYDAFVKLVDGIGGVTVNVPYDVRFFGNNKVYFTKGVHKMNGGQAFQYVHVREDDISRVGRQQGFVKTFASQALTLSNMPKLPGILNNVVPDIQTDMSPSDMFNLVMEIRSIGTGNITNKIVPGKGRYINGISYWIPNQTETKKDIQQMFNY